MRVVAILAFAIVLIFPAGAHAEDAAIDAAIEFLQTACVNKGSGSNFEVNGSIDASLKGLQSSLIQGKATYTKKEIQGLSASLNEFSSKQASEARQCMQPYIMKIIDIILKSNINQAESLSDNDMKSIRNAILNNKEQLSRALIHNTHPSGRYNDSYHPSFAVSTDKQTIDTEITINWQGVFLRHTTVFLLKTGKSGKTDLQVASDNAQIRIAAENLRTARSSAEKIIQGSMR